MSRHQIGFGVLFAVVLLALSVRPAAADTIEIFGDSSRSTEGLGMFSGSVGYEADPLSTTGLLRVLLTNTSPADNGGYLTGFLFNIASSDPNASATLLDDRNRTNELAQATRKGLSGAPYCKRFDAGAAICGKFLGGGRPSRGIAVGDSSVFEFLIQASDSSSLTALSFVEGGPCEFNFITRFRGFDDCGSDKVPTTVVPLPAPLALGLAGLVGLAFGTRRIRRTTMM